MDSGSETKVPGPPARSKAAVRVDSLTGLRGVAALVVVGTHASALTVGGLHSGLAWVVGQGRLGVSFFFLLSGFVLVWSAKPNDAPRSFWRRRFARIYPAYLVALLVGLVLSHAGGHDPTPAGPLVASLLLVQAWIPDPTWFFAVNVVGWSLSVEAFFYLVFPYLVRVLRRHDVQWRLRLLQGLVTLFVIVQGVAWLADARNGRSLLGVDGTIEWFAYIFPPVRLIEFVLGMLLALRVRDEGWRPRLTFPAAAGLAAAAYLAAGVSPTMLGWEAVTLVPLMLLISAAAVADAGDARTVFVSRRWVWLGSVSYCLYLVHREFFRVVAHVFGLALHGFAGAVVVVGATVAAVLGAWALHRFVELPADTILRGRRAAAPVSMFPGN